MTLTGHKDKVQVPGGVARPTARWRPAAGTARRGSGTGAPVATSAASRTRVRWSDRWASRRTASCWYPAPAARRSPHVWEVATGKTVATYTKHDNVVVAAAISPDGRLVATAGGNAYPIHIWETRTGQGQQILEGTGKNTWSVGFARDGKTHHLGRVTALVNHNARGPLELQLRLPAAKQSSRPARARGRPAELRAGVHDVRRLLAGASQGR